MSKLISHVHDVMIMIKIAHRNGLTITWSRTSHDVIYWFDWQTASVTSQGAPNVNKGPVTKLWTAVIHKNQRSFLPLW